MLASFTPRKHRMTKSDLIRQYIAKHRGQGPKEIHAGMKAEGNKVSMALINFVKYKRPKARRATSNGAEKWSLNDLVAAKQMADKLGGIDKAREALSALAKLG